MRVKFFVFFLIINLAIGSGLGYLLVVTPEPTIPAEFINLAIDEQIEASSILADRVLKQLGTFETQTIGAAALLKEIFLNRSIIPGLPSYYHDLETINRLVLSALPSERFVSEKYNDRVISLSASGYKIAPTGFVEEYTATYLEEENEPLDPMTQLPASTVQEIINTAKLDHILKSLYSLDPSTVWIEYMSEKGFSRSYPWTTVPKEYDGRSESWYASASTGAKDVVVLIDKSGSMEGDRKIGAINATKNIIAGLGGRDRFNIIEFSDKIKSFTSALSLVSEENLENANNFLDSMVTGGTTNFDLAFRQGLDVLNQYGSSRRTPVVVFITDGAPTVGTQNNDTLIENILQANGPVGAQFVLFGISAETDHKLLADIAIATNGANIRINTTEQIEPAISGYRDFLSLNKKASLTWSQPYIDSNEQGLVLTVSYPVLTNTRLRGVVSVDISLHTLIEFIEADLLTENSYSYIFDLAGNNIAHPRVDLNTSSNDEIRRPIIELETDDEVFLEMLGLAQIDQRSTQIIKYDGEDQIVSLNPIGNTSMILGITTPLLDLIPDEVENKLNQLSINQLAFLPGIGLGLISVIILLVMRKRLTRGDNEVTEIVSVLEIPKEETS